MKPQNSCNYNTSHVTLPQRIKIYMSTYTIIAFHQQMRNVTIIKVKI